MPDARPEASQRAAIFISERCPAPITLNHPRINIYISYGKSSTFLIFLCSIYIFPHSKSLALICSSSLMQASNVNRMPYLAQDVPLLSLCALAGHPSNLLELWYICGRRSSRKQYRPRRLTAAKDTACSVNLSRTEKSVLEVGRRLQVGHQRLFQLR